MVSFSQFTTEINQTWPSRDPTQGLLDTTLKPDLNLKAASLEAIFMKNQALENGCGYKADGNLKTIYCASEALILGLQMFQEEF